MTITPLGEKVMLGKCGFVMAWPGKTREESPIKSGLNIEIEDMGFDPKLFALLKGHRAEIAKAQNVPPYVVFSNKTLEYFTRLRPSSVEAGMRIKGVGEVKAGQYLASFINVIKDYS